MSEFVDLSDPPSPVLVVAAHPDDIDFGSAGTMAVLTSNGAEVTYLLVTAGEAGAPDHLNRTQVAELRVAEQQAAAEAVGVHEVRVLDGYHDGRVEATLSLRRDIARVIRDVKPQLMFVPSPEARWDRIYASHPDHRATGEAAMGAVYPDARNPHSHLELLDEGYEPHAVPEVWVAGLPPVDTFVDITDVIDRKVAALTAHASQTGEMDVDNLLREWAADLAKSNGLPDGRLSEAFRRVVTA